MIYSVDSKATQTQEQGPELSEAQEIKEWKISIGKAIFWLKSLFFLLQMIMQVIFKWCTNIWFKFLDLVYNILFKNVVERLYIRKN